MIKKICHLICFLSIVALLGGCNDDRNPYPIPNYYPVNISILLDSFDSDLAIGRVKTFNSQRGSAGYFGVVVYRYGAEDFYAYDMACPNDHYSGCTVIEHSLTATDPHGLNLECSRCCKTKFSLLSGYPVETTFYKYPLRQYQVTKVRDRQFLVYN